MWGIWLGTAAPEVKSHCKGENPPPPDTVNDTHQTQDNGRLLTLMDIVCKGVWLKPVHSILPVIQNISSNTENGGTPKRENKNQKERARQIQRSVGSAGQEEAAAVPAQPNPAHVCNTNYQECCQALYNFKNILKDD